MLKLLARLLYEQGKLNLDEAFVDATFASAKKGALLLVPRVVASFHWVEHFMRLANNSSLPNEVVSLADAILSMSRTKEMVGFA